MVELHIADMTAEIVQEAMPSVPSGDSIAENLGQYSNVAKILAAMAEELEARGA